MVKTRRGVAGGGRLKQENWEVPHWAGQPSGHGHITNFFVTQPQGVWEKSMGKMSSVWWWCPKPRVELGAFDGAAIHWLHPPSVMGYGEDSWFCTVEIDKVAHSAIEGASQSSGHHATASSKPPELQEIDKLGKRHSVFQLRGVDGFLLSARVVLRWVNLRNAKLTPQCSHCVRLIPYSV